MATRIPIFRKFKHAELTKIGVKDGNADGAFLLSAAENTNRLIREKRHVPPIKQTHSGSVDGTARGWTQGVSTDGSTLFAEIELTPKGKQQVSDKELRFVSASFRKDFALTGEPDGERLSGPYLDHVALLGDENPAVKALVDLAQIQFSEGAKVPRAWIMSDPAKGEVTYFAEMNPMMAAPICECCAEGDCKCPSNRGTTCACGPDCLACGAEGCTPGDNESDDTNANNREHRMDQIASLTEKNTKLAADFAEEKKKREEAEAKLKARDEADAAAKFSAHKESIKARIDAAVKAKKLTAEKAITLTARGEKAYGNEEAMALFSELLDSLNPVVPPPIPDDDKQDEKPTGVTAADFSETQSDQNKIRRVHEATMKYLDTHPPKEGTPWPAAYAQAQNAIRAAVVTK